MKAANFVKLFLYFINLFLLPTNGFCNQSSFLENKKAYDLVICAIFQDEAFFLQEWIEFHRLVGVQHFYLYNNNSQDNYKEILEPYIESGIVELFNWPVTTHHQQDYLYLLQLPAYNHALTLVKKTARWAAFIDLDEFIVPVKGDHLIPLLEEYKDFAGIALNWQVYGTSYLDSLAPHQLIIESLLWKACEEMPINKTVKLIVQPQAVKKIEDPHFFTYEEGFFAINTSKEPIRDNTRWHPLHIDTIRINHYWFGPYDWFVHHKIPRRAKWGIKIAEDYLEDLIQSYNEVEDPIMLKFVSSLKKNLNQKSN